MLSIILIKIEDIVVYIKNTKGNREVDFIIYDFFNTVFIIDSVTESGEYPIFIIDIWNFIENVFSCIRYFFS